MNSNFDFDLGLGSSRSRSRSLNDQKNNSSKTTPSWQPSYSQPGRPSWTHQPGGPTSMAGDIFGKSWGSAAPKSAGSGVGVGVGVVNKNPNLFGDLVSSALGQNKVGSSNAPLKSAPKSSSFSMAGVADSLPRTSSYSNSSGIGIGNSGVMKNSNSGGIGNIGMNSGGIGNSGINSSGIGNSGGIGSGGFGSGGMMRNSNSGGASIRGGMSSNKDPFGSLVDFTSKPMNSAGLNSAAKPTSTPSPDFAFGDFQNASKPNSSGSPFSSANSDPLGSNSSAAPKMSGFASQNQTPAQPSGGDSFDMFFTSTPASSGIGTTATSSDTQGFSGGDDWGFGEEQGGSTTELEGLPPPPAGVSGSSAKAKGLDNYKQGQYADAIKWLSWAEVLLEKAGETSGMMEVLSCRASCYKEVGEYKKAVADCTKVLDHDGENVAVLVQRALLYESMEKYRLGADDLRTVMKLDPGNRVARSTIHRLNKMAD